MEQKKTVVITGASSGIGLATARLLAVNGTNLILAARGEQALEEAAEQCRAEGAEVVTVKADVSRHEDVQRISQEAINTFGAFDVWVNNAGLIGYGTFVETSPEEFRQIIESNFFGTVYGTRTALAYFKTTGRGHVINVCSALGGFPGPYASAYVSSKFAVRAFSATVRQELGLEGEKDIHVSTVLPATIDTPIYQHAANRRGKEVIALPPAYPVDLVAERIASVIERPRPETVAGYAGRLAIGVYQVWPRAGEKVMAWYVDRFNTTDKSVAEHEGNLFASKSTAQTSGNWPTWQQRAGKVVGLALLGALAGGVTSVLGRRKESKSS